MNAPLQHSPWAGSLTVYFILIGISSGITLQQWWIRPREAQASDTFEWYGGWIAFVLLAAAGAILIVDLGQPTRFFLMLTSFSNLGSPMAVGAKLIGIKAGLLALYLFLLHKRRLARAIGDPSEPEGVTAALFRGVPIALGVASFGLAVYPATLLSRTWIAPLASSPAASVIFLLTSLAAGAAISTIIAHVVRDVADDTFRTRIIDTVLFLVAIEALLFVFEGLALHGNSPALAHALDQLTTGAWSNMFWGLVVGVGLAVPIICFGALRTQRIAVLTGAAGVVIGSAAVRYLFLVNH